MRQIFELTSRSIHGVFDWEIQIWILRKTQKPKTDFAVSGIHLEEEKLT